MKSEGQDPFLQNQEAATTRSVFSGRKARQPPFAGLLSKTGFLLLLAFIGVVLARVTYLESDAPEGLPAEEDYGVYVDEGYKTLSARNRVVFGMTQWHPGDDYSGWAEASPITQGAFYLAFTALGQNLTAARLVSVAWFAIFLAAFCIAYYRDRTPGVLWAGLLMLGFQHVLWVHSRTAIFEIAALSVFFGALLLLRRFTTSVPFSAAVTVIAGLVATFGIKQNAPTIVVPALVGILALWAIEKRRLGQFLLFLLFGGVLLILPRVAATVGLPFPFDGPAIMGRLDLLPPTNVVERFLVNPILRADPFLVILTHACAISILLHRPRFFEGNPYRASLFSIVFFGMAALATVPARLRYSVLLIPALILLVLEWWGAQDEGSSSLPPAEKGRLSKSGVMTVLFIVSFDLVFLAAFFRRLFFDVPETSGRAWLYMIPVAGALASFIWTRHNTFLSAPVLRTFIFTAMAAFALFNSYKVGASLVRPDWQRRAISNELIRILPPEATVAGDWIPLFAIGTDLRVLYSASRINRPERFQELRPSHFLYSDTERGRAAKKIIERLDGVAMGPPLMESRYTGVKVELHALHYE